MRVSAVLLLAGCGGGGGGGGEVQEKADPAVLQSQAAEGESVLTHVSALQQAYRADKGRWAASFDELREAGWEERGLQFYQQPRIIRAQGDELCIVIEPTPAHATLWPQHLDQVGDVTRGPCP